MFIKTIIPDSNSVTILLPDSFVGEEVKLIAVVEKKQNKSESIKDEISKIRNRYSVYPRVDVSGFTFNRDDANDFE